MTEISPTILPEIFNQSLSLDNRGGSRALGLFERMAASLDEIAANTRGLTGGVVARAVGRGKTAENGHKPSGSSGENAVLASSRPRSGSGARRRTTANRKTGNAGIKDLQAARSDLSKLESAQPSELAAGAKTSPALAASASSAQPASVPVAEARSLAGNAGPAASIARTMSQAQIATPMREPAKAESIREIDPGREIKTPGADNGPLVQLLGGILSAIEAGNRQMAKLMENKGNEGAPEIRMDYDDPAARSLAADTA